MSEIPTINQFGITTPVFIRKIDSKNRWTKYSSEKSNIQDCDQKIANDVFKTEKCSLWWVESNDDFYGFVASISSNRSPQNQNIDFIWLTKDDLDELDIKYEQVPEGDCLAVKHLHYDAIITESQAILICRKLLDRNQEPQRCAKKVTQLILEYQQQKGCVAVTKSTKLCTYYSCC